MTGWMPCHAEVQRHMLWCCSSAWRGRIIPLLRYRRLNLPATPPPLFAGTLYVFICVCSGTLYNRYHQPGSGSSARPVLAALLAMIACSLGELLASRACKGCTFVGCCAVMRLGAQGHILLTDMQASALPPNPPRSPLLALTQASACPSHSALAGPPSWSFCCSFAWQRAACTSCLCGTCLRSLRCHSSRRHPPSASSSR